jgi:hypothetical protein
VERLRLADASGTAVDHLRMRGAESIRQAYGGSSRPPAS